MLVVAVAASGGRDSTALLHCTARAGQQLGLHVVALHVHHGLMPQADAWQHQVRAQARRWGADFAAQRLESGPEPGDSVEAWARRARYAALAAMAHNAGAGLVLLAHHRRDQAETWLLQALRGGGPRGLAAMPAVASRQGVTWARPWLDMPREAIDAYVRRHRLRCVDDASNTDPRFARSRLRGAVWPALMAAFPDAETAFASAAARAQEAVALAVEVAEADLPAVAGPLGLHTPPWQGLPPARRANVLRVWLASVLGRGAPEVLVQRLCREVPTARIGSWPVGSGSTLRLYRGVLALAPPEGAPRPARMPSGPLLAGRQFAEPAKLQDFSRVGLHHVPAWAGALQVTVVQAGGVAIDVLQAASLRQRSGGERFQRTAGGTPRSLKLQFQAAAVPAWDRHGPLLFAADGRLLFVPGLGIDARCLAPPGVPQRHLQWLPAPTA